MPQTESIDGVRDAAADYFKLSWKLCVIPAGTKGPRLAGWNRKEQAITSLDNLPADSVGLGLLHAYSGTCALDIDDVGAAKQFLLARGINLQQLAKAPDAVILQGNRKRLKLLFSLSEPVQTISRQDLGFELRCATAEGLSVQDVLPPSEHPDSREPYRWVQWTGQAPPQLPDSLRALWQELLAKPRSRQHLAITNPLLAAAGAVYDPPTAEQVRADLEKIDPDCGYEQWLKVVWGVLSTGLPHAEELAREWSQSAPHRYDERVFNSLVSNYRPKPGGITYGTVRKFATEATAPEPQPLPDSLSPVAAFDDALLPEVLRPWVRDIAERIGCPPDFIAVPAMVALGSIIGRKVAIRPQQQTDWAEVPNLWGLIVGRPGMLKSPAMQQALAPLRRLAVAAQERYDAERAEWAQRQRLRELQADAAEKQARQALTKDSGADVAHLLTTMPDDAEPTLKRYALANATPEALGELLRQNPQGVLLERDEIMGFLRDLDREDRADHRAFMLETWGGNGSFTFDRIGRGFNLHIPAMCLSIVGTTQPGRLRAYIAAALQGGAGDDGLVQRFGMMVWPDTPSNWRDVDRWPDTAAKHAAWAVFDRLDKVTAEGVGAQQDLAPDGEPEGLPYLRLDDDAHARFLAWRTDLETRLRGDLHPAIESHLAKYRKLVPALALICHLADECKGLVGVAAIEKALAWAAYLETHAQRCFSVGTQAEAATARAILRRLKKGDLQASGFSSRDLWRPQWSGLTDRGQVAQALDFLVSMDWLLAQTKPTGGRDATVYTLNPRANL